MIAVLCLFLKRMRGLATFSLFHILLGANLLLSIGKQWLETNTERSWWPPETKSSIWKCAFQGNCACVIENRQETGRNDRKEI